MRISLRRPNRWLFVGDLLLIVVCDWQFRLRLPLVRCSYLIYLRRWL
jgi:hypothetical protein